MRKNLTLDETPKFHEAWAEILRIIGKYPSLRTDLENAVSTKMAKSSVQRTMQWLKAFEHRYLKVNTGYLTVESHDDSIRQAAESIAMRVQRAFQEEILPMKYRDNRSAHYRKNAGIALVKTICEGMEIQPPKLPREEDLSTETVASVVARLVDAKWWRRRIRTLQARKLETASRLLGATCKKRGGYCSFPTLRRHNASKIRNRELLEKLEATNNEGQSYTLAELSDLGVSNPVNRRNELMVRIRGTEEYAQEFPEFVPAFITHTCPSRFHSHHRSGKQYNNWDKSTPRDAQQYLSSIWARTRAKLKRNGIECFGFRVAEPHHDGCPHWHLLLWFRKDQIKQALSIYRAYALEESPDEPGAYKRRFTAKLNELAKGATGYIAKYISKNVDGLQENGEDWSKDSIKTALRTEAWARTWGIRQFQQIGGVSVTVYRECRRLTFSKLREQIASLTNTTTQNTLDAIRAAADTSNWCQFLQLMGGATVARDEQPLRAYMLVKLDEDNTEAKNAYGEIVEQLKGCLAWKAIPIITRLYEWVIQPKQDQDIFQEAHAPPLVLCQ